MTAIWKRELGAYFRTGIGYVFLSIFLLAGGIFFVMHNLARASGSIGTLFNNLMYLFLLVVPILTMRLISEERRGRTDQLLLTSPIGPGSIVVGKFLSAVTVFFMGMVFTGTYALIIARYGQASWGQLLANYLGFFLMGTSYIAVGVLASSLTESQVTAALLTFGLNIAIQFAEGAARQLPTLWGPLSGALSFLSLGARYTAFEAGIVALPNVTYYLLFGAIMLALSTFCFDRRR